MTTLAEKRRPTGVTAIAILNIIIGSVYLIGGLLLESWFPVMFKDPYWSSNVPGFLRAFLIGIGIWLFIQAYGFWQGRGLARILCGILIAACLFFLPWMYLDEHDPRFPPITSDLIWFFQFLVLGIINIVFFIYLIKAHVNAFFEKTQVHPSDTLKFVALVIITMMGVAGVTAALTYPKVVASYRVSATMDAPTEWKNFDVPLFHSRLQVEVSIVSGSAFWDARILRDNVTIWSHSQFTDQHAQNPYSSEWIPLSPGHYNFIFGTLGTGSVEADVAVASKDGFW